MTRAVVAATFESVNSVPEAATRWTARSVTPYQSASSGRGMSNFRSATRAGVARAKPIGNFSAEFTRNFRGLRRQSRA